MPFKSMSTPPFSAMLQRGTIFWEFLVVTKPFSKGSIRKRNNLLHFFFVFKVVIITDLGQRQKSV